jgi:ParB/RepB/Spo0J family partition protein
MDTTIAEIPLKAIVESPSNPRKTFGDMEALTESIRSKGILQPVTVRQQPGAPSGFELVVGARRFRAAKAAGLKTIPAMVRELDDKAVLEVQIIENSQRQDVHPLEEADGYRALMDVHGYTVDDIAAKVGKSKAFVYGRLKLCALCEVGRKAFLEERLSPSVALLVARIPDQKLQEKAVEEVSESVYGSPMSFREAAAHIEGQFMLRLADAPFIRTDADLVPGAGPCSTCPNRTGNQAELFSDVKSADVCILPSCFAKKKAAEAKRFKEEQEAKGRKVVSGKGVFGYDGSVVEYCDFVDLKGKVPDDKEGRTWKQVLGGAEVEVCVTRDGKGKVRELVKKDQAKDVAKAAGVKVAAPKAGYDFKAEQEKRDREGRLANLVADGLLDKLVAGAESVHPLEALLALCDVLLDGERGLGELVEKRRGWGEGTAAKMFQEMDVGELQGMALELGLELLGIRDHWSQEHHDKLISSLCKQFLVDRKSIVAVAKADLAAEEKEKKAAEGAKAGAKAPPKKGEAGVCSSCGCTETKPCDDAGGACEWVDKTKTLCTACVEPEPGDKPVKKPVKESVKESAAECPLEPGKPKACADCDDRNCCAGSTARGEQQKKGGLKASAFQVGDHVQYQQGRGTFDAIVTGVEADLGVVCLERCKDGKRLERPAVKVTKGWGL